MRAKSACALISSVGSGFSGCASLKLHLFTHLNKNETAKNLFSKSHFLSYKPLLKTCSKHNNKSNKKSVIIILFSGIKKQSVNTI